MISGRIEKTDDVLFRYAAYMGKFFYHTLEKQEKFKGKGEKSWNKRENSEDKQKKLDKMKKLLKF